MIGNLAVSKNNGQNHYCAFWVDKVKKVVEVWDSATSGIYGSAFTKLFRHAAELLFLDTFPFSTKWANKIIVKRSTSSVYSFQHGGGYLGKNRSLLSQNIYCHTWTLFYLELRLFNQTPAKIGCGRGSHPWTPLMTIKLYAQCLLRRMNKNVSDPAYKGLFYIWDDQNKKARTLPILHVDGQAGKMCAMRVEETVLKSKKFYKPTIRCEHLFHIH